MGTHNLSMIGDMPIAQPNTLTLLAFFNLAIERGAGRIEVVRRAIDVATYLGAAIPINAVDGITAACLCIMQPARFKNCQEAARACGCSKTNCYMLQVAQAAARQDSRRAGKRRGWQQHRRRLHGSICAAHGRGDISRSSRLVSRGRNHRLPHSPGSPIAIRRTRPTGSWEAPPRSAAPPSIPPSPPVMTPVSKQGHAQTPGTAPATTPTTHKRAESDAGLDDGEDLGASPGGPGRVLPRPLSTGVRKDEWTASFEGDTFVRRCNFNWVDENGNDLPNTAATVALRKNGDLLRGRSAPSKCDRLNIE